jgi:metal-dependent amidase/aminoacylase/carboxypeptidase family protein
MAASHTDVRIQGAATALEGATDVDANPMPSMASEDFAFMLRAKQRCYIWLGGGRGPDTPNLHSPHCDFNDDALPIGARYRVARVEQQLTAHASVRRAA